MVIYNILTYKTSYSVILKALLAGLMLLSFGNLYGRDTSQGIKDERLRTLRVEHSAGNFLPPVVIEGTDDAIDISFDILGEEPEYLRYRLIHCNADWQPSGLTDIEILDRFNEKAIETYDYSRATSVSYIHYQFEALSGDMRPRVPGNYLIEIYSEEDPDRVLATVRTGLCSGETAINARISGITDRDYNERHQQLSLTVTDRNATVENMFNDLTVTVTQNRRNDMRVKLSHPLRSAGREAVYEHVPELIFPGGNEYRRFETVSTRFLPMGVEAMDYSEPYYRFYLQPDLPRAATQYLYDRTQRGRFTIRNADSRNTEDNDLEADYGIVFFRLEMPQALGKIHLIGDFNSQIISTDSEMPYNPLTGCYEKALLLKQGAYNYQYVCENASGKISNCVDGNYHNTVNEYEIRVYQRRRGDRADRLIGILTTDTSIQ